MVESGRFQLYDAALPPLSSGRYRIKLAHVLGPEVTDPPPGPVAFEVVVGDLAEGRGRVAPHPFDGAAGDFSDELPFVVLDRRTLPWERPGFGISGVPWLTVVVTREDAPAEAALVGPAGPADIGTLRCLDTATQTRLLARPADVRLLAHVRETNVTDTALSGGDADGWQAVVVANRLPRAPGRWRATLVSLADRADLVGGSPTLGLTALSSSTFTITATAGGFGSRLAAMVPGRFGDPAAVAAVDATGAVELVARDRQGHTEPVRYRPPLLSAAAQLDVPEAAPDLTVPPDRTGTIAGELGRLLSAADDRLLRDLAQWRRATLAARARAATERGLAADDPDPDSAGRRALVRADVGTAADLGQRTVTAALARWRLDTLPRTGERGAAAAPGARPAYPDGRL